jgi:hypothetical protein
MNKDVRTPSIGESVMRGVMIGGGVGLIGGIFFLQPGRALFLGFVCGLLAGLTHWRLRKDRIGG